MYRHALVTCFEKIVFSKLILSFKYNCEDLPNKSYYPEHFKREAVFITQRRNMRSVRFYQSGKYKGGMVQQYLDVNRSALYSESGEQRQRPLQRDIDNALGAQRSRRGLAQLRANRINLHTRPTPKNNRLDCLHYYSYNVSTLLEFAVFFRVSPHYNRRL